MKFVSLSNHLALLVCDGNSFLRNFWHDDLESRAQGSVQELEISECQKNEKPKTSIANLVDVLVVHVKRNHLNGYKIIVAKCCLISIMYRVTGRYAVTVFIYYQVNHHSN